VRNTIQRGSTGDGGDIEGNPALQISKGVNAFDDPSELDDGIHAVVEL
jgi:hypothetical protein